MIGGKEMLLAQQKEPVPTFTLLATVESTGSSLESYLDIKGSQYGKWGTYELTQWDYDKTELPIDQDYTLIVDPARSAQIQYGTAGRENAAGINSSGYVIPQHRLSAGLKVTLYVST